MASLLTLIFTLTFIFFSIIALILTIQRKIRKDNMLDKRFGWLITIQLLFLNSKVIAILLDITSLNILPDFTIWDLATTLTLVGYIQFIIVLYEKKKLYIFGLYLIFVTISASSIEMVDYFILGLAIFVVLIGFFFLHRGIMNHEGVLFSFGLLGILDGFSNIILQFSNIDKTFFSHVQLFSIIAIILGLSGWLDEHILYNREDRKKKSKNWANIVVSKTAEKPLKSKRIMIRCPICEMQRMKKISAETMSRRFNMNRGLIKMLILSPDICEHTFIAYIDNYFDIRGYDTIEIVEFEDSEKDFILNYNELN